MGNPKMAEENNGRVIDLYEELSTLTSKFNSPS